MLDPRKLKYGLSFDDVTLVPDKAEVLPSEVDVCTRLTRKIRIEIPILSAAMDCVTEARMAIALAQEGGLGVIHRNLSVEQQAIEVDCVKRSESGVITDPITLSPDRKVREAMTIMDKYHISGVPITVDDKLVGILTNRDIRFHDNPDLEVSEVMTSDNLVTVPPGTTLEEAKVVLHNNRVEKVPVVDEDGQLCGLITFKDIRKAMIYPSATKDEYGRLRCGAAVGTAPGTFERAAELVKAGVDVLVVDTAHGHSAKVLEVVEKLKSEFSSVEVIAGNVATADGTEALIGAGADAVKVGMGPGATCTTRVVSGAGVPQITAVADCAHAGAKHDVPVISDGGIRYSGDIAKAIAAGAESVMIGSLFAGTQEGPGEMVLYEGRSFKVYRGMGSLKAMIRGGSDRYFQRSDGPEDLVPEGIEGRVPYRGPMAACVHQLVGGLRAGMGYCGVRDIDELRAKARFLQVTPAGIRESHPHDMIITEDAPNYWRQP